MSTIPKKQFNNSSSTLRTPSLLVMDRRSVNSPITELSNNFTELAANESSCDNTPKRRLSLTSSTGSPTPDIIRQHSVLTSSCKSTSSDVSNNSLELPGPLFKTVDSLEKQAGNGM
ncbi:hypothetical protein EB796_018103 [Bugula neritina]|uniref:Uncharacterized protein n=1 Tax=Bugula neritina TaxID=10212 RepID=A0A7J7JBG4_BUGNE|nr:hypothetical protein EB796_018103 [Bugula neritina]